MNTQKLERTQYNLLPDDPGVYRFFDDEGIIYVGKAKNLKKRVASYFTKGDHNRKTYKLVQEIRYIEVTVVNSEFDALLLENSLIKENQPKYNILLKDDKSFPSICITNERFPRIYSTRRIDRSKGQYFGPYTSVKAMNNVLDLIRKLYKIRTCNFNLSESNISKGKFKVCLEFHIGNCLGPCEGLQEEHEYMIEIAQAKEILKGNISPIRKSFVGQMQEAANELNFELAQSLKVKLEYLEKFQIKSLIVQQKLTNLDVFTILHDDPKSYINFMMIEEGTIKISETVEVKNNLTNRSEDILQHSMLSLRDKYQSSNKEILTNIELEDWPEISITVPKIGDKKKLIDLSLKNAFMTKREKQAQAENIKNKPNHALIELKKELQLTEMPYHIECFDNSNIQGTHPVASMVCFKNGKPSKKDYRKFNIKTVVGPDDFSSMYEIVTRRYAKLKNEELPYPKLIVIDGGKGQLSAAVKALKDLDVYGEIPIVGIAKRLEEIYVPYDPIPLHISKKSEGLKLLQHARDEAHRFAITFHRQKRSKSSLKSELDEIDGIGQKTRELLFREFGSVEKIKKADFEKLSAAVGSSKAQLLKSAFKNS